MSSYTRHLRLVKPSIDEAYDIDVFNNNFDKIDREFEEKIASDSFTSEDENEPEELATMPEVMADGDDRSTLFNKISVVVKNVRYLIGLIGNTDISAIGDGSITDAINEVNDDLSELNDDLTANNQKYQADYQNGKYGFIIDNEFHPFSQGTIYLGEYSANTTIDVSDLGATSADQFLVVPSSKGGSGQTYQDFGAGGSLYCFVSCSYTEASITLTNGVLSITAPSISGSANHANAAGAGAGYATSASAIPTYKVYYIGDVETSS